MDQIFKTSRCSAWPTPNTPSGGRSIDPSKMTATGKTLDGRKHTVSLEHVVRFTEPTSWATPTTRDHKDGACHETIRGGADAGQRAARETSNPHRPWDELKWLECSDGKARPTQPGLFPLASGIPCRVGRLRAYGNAIVPQVAAEFIKACM